MLWLLRLSLILPHPPSILAELLTADDLALYQAWVEVDGPWWGEREAALLRQLCSVVAATSGSKIPPDDFKSEWTVGPATETAGANLLPPADGLAIFAARHGLTLTEEPR